MNLKKLARWNNRADKKTNGELIPAADMPFSLSLLRDRFDQLFERMAEEFALLPEPINSGWRWDVDVEDAEEAVKIRAEAPGFNAEDFDLRVENGQLVMRASKAKETKDEKGAVVKTEKRECYEAIAIPDGVDKNKVEANYHNGILTVTLPKMPGVRPQRIAVKAT